MFKSFLHFCINNKKELRPNFVLGLIRFCSIKVFDEISKLTKFLFENSWISLIVLSPIDRFGLFIILSKAKSSLGWLINLKYATQSLISALS